MATSAGPPPGWRMDWDHSASRCVFIFEASGFRQWDFPKAGDELKSQQSDQGDALQSPAALNSPQNEQPKNQHPQKESAGEGSSSPSQNLTSPPSQVTTASSESQAKDKPQEEKHPVSSNDNPSDTKLLGTTEDGVTKAATQLSVEQKLEGTDVAASQPVSSQPTVSDGQKVDMASNGSNAGNVLLGSPDSKSDISMPSETGATTTSSMPSGENAQPLIVIPASELAKYMPNALPTSGETPQFYVLQAPQGGILQQMLGVQPPPPYSATNDPAQDAQTHTKAATEAPISSDDKEKAVEPSTDAQDVGTVKSGDQAGDTLSKQESKLSREDTRSSVDAEADADRCSLTSTQSPPPISEEGEGIRSKSQKLTKWSSKKFMKTVSKTGNLVKSTANKTMPVMASTATKTKSAFASAASKTVPVMASTASKTGGIMASTATKTGGIMASAAKRTGTIVASTAKETGNVMKGALNSQAATFVTSAVGDAVIEAAGKHFGVAGASTLVNHSLSKLGNDLSDVKESIGDVANDLSEFKEAIGDVTDNLSGVKEAIGDVANELSEITEAIGDEIKNEVEEKIESKVEAVISTVQSLDVQTVLSDVPQVLTELSQEVVVLPQQNLQQINSQTQSSSTTADLKTAPEESSKPAANDSVAAPASSPKDQSSDPISATTLANLQQQSALQLQASLQAGALTMPSNLQQQLQANAVLPPNLQQQLQTQLLLQQQQQQLQQLQQLQAGAALPSNLQQQLQAQLMLQQQQQQLALQQQQQFTSQQLQMLLPGTPPGETGSYFFVQPGTQIGQQQQMLSLNTQVAALPSVAGPAAAPTPPASPPDAKEVTASPTTKGSRFGSNMLKSLAVNVAAPAIITAGSNVGDAISSLIS